MKICISAILPLMSLIFFPPVRHLFYSLHAILQVCVCKVNVGLGKIHSGPSRGPWSPETTEDQETLASFCIQHAPIFQPMCSGDIPPFRNCSWIIQCLDPRKPICLSEIAITLPETNHNTQTVTFFLTLQKDLVSWYNTPWSEGGLCFAICNRLQTN